MAALVTVEEVNNALRLDLELDADPYAGDGDTSRLDDIEAKIDQASDVVLDYIKNPDGTGDWDVSTAPPRVKAATIIVVRCLLDDTEESLAMLSGLAGASPADMRNPIAALLWRLRDPALA